MLVLSNGGYSTCSWGFVRCQDDVWCNVRSPCAWEGISSCRNSGVSAHPARSGQHILDHAAHRSISWGQHFFCSLLDPLLTPCWSSACAWTPCALSSFVSSSPGRLWRCWQLGRDWDLLLCVCLVFVLYWIVWKLHSLQMLWTETD